mmetsp:Transcript_54218/g.166814  ORF Transcript_54218/g.166814 Transcript_54218/m.166814 type:complete len:248 (+) Transcript_54218:77-820(+)
MGLPHGERPPVYVAQPRLQLEHRDQHVQAGPDLRHRRAGAERRPAQAVRRVWVHLRARRARRAVGGGDHDVGNEPGQLADDVQRPPVPAAPAVRDGEQPRPRLGNDRVERHEQHGQHELPHRQRRRRRRVRARGRVQLHRAVPGGLADRGGGDVRLRVPAEPRPDVPQVDVEPDGGPRPDRLPAAGGGVAHEPRPVARHHEDAGAAVQQHRLPLPPAARPLPRVRRRGRAHRRRGRGRHRRDARDQG